MSLINSVYAQVFKMPSHICCRQESEEWLLENLKNRHRVKNDKTSEYFRTEGNYAFQRTDYFNSLRCYSRSVRFANRDGVNYGLALANRSATLYYLGDFEV